MPKSKKSEDSVAWTNGWEDHRNNQILNWALNSTAEQRLRWVEEMLLFMLNSGQSYRERKKRFSA